MPVQQWPLRTDTRFGRNDVLAGRYHLEGLLGRGGAADVYRGFDLRLRRPVAVKVFRPGGDAQTEERFTEEAVTLAGLQHPGLVTVFDSGREAGSPFLVMRLITGQTLRERVASGVLTPGEVCAVGAALADALDFVHAAGVVHRDVKPSNILMDEAGAPHLTDFGISRLMDSTAHTATGALVGTAAYLAPEQVLGRVVGPAADVYALGLTLLECLKGELEYDGAPLEAAIARVHRPPVLPPFLDDELAALLGAMTARDEDRRPDARTCADVLAALSAAESPTGPPSRPVPVPVPGGHDTPPHSTLGAGTLRTHHASPARRASGRTLATAGAALATLVGVTLTGMAGLPGHGPDTAAAPDRHASAAPRVKPSETPAAAPDPDPGAGSASAEPSSRSGPDTSSSSAPAARGHAPEGRQVAASARAERPLKSPKHKAAKKEAAHGRQKAPK